MKDRVSNYTKSRRAWKSDRLKRRQEVRVGQHCNHQLVFMYLRASGTVMRISMLGQPLLTELTGTFFSENRWNLLHHMYFGVQQMYSGFVSANFRLQLYWIRLLSTRWRWCMWIPRNMFFRFSSLSCTIPIFSFFIDTIRFDTMDWISLMSNYVVSLYCKYPGFWQQCTAQVLV